MRQGKERLQKQKRTIIAALFVLLLLLLGSIGWWWPGAAVHGQAQPGGSCAAPTFRAGNAYAETAWVLAAGDFNGDGKVDLAGVNINSGTLTTYLGDGQGALQVGARVAFAPGIRLLKTGDANGDGKLDLYSYNAPAEQLQIWEGNGDGTFKVNFPATHAIHLAELWRTNLPEMELADFNNDGRADILLYSQKFEFRYQLILVTATGLQFAASATLPEKAALVAGDVNLDGKLDLVIGQRTPGKLLWRAGSGDGQFGAVTDLYAAQSEIRGVGLADFNRAGRRDLVIVTGDPNQGLSAPDAWRVQLLTRANSSEGYRVASSLGGSVAHTLNGDLRVWQLADLTGDGRPEVLLRNLEPAFLSALIVNNGAGGLCAPSNLLELSAGPTLADFNRDGKTDLVISENGQIRILLNQTGALATTPPIITSAIGINAAQGRLITAQLATVSDVVDAPQVIRVEVINRSSGLTVTGVSNFGGQVFANILIACQLAPGDYGITLRASNTANLSALTEVKVTVTAMMPFSFRTVPASLTLREGITQALAVVPWRGAAAAGTAITIAYGDANAAVATKVEVSLDGRALPPALIVQTQNSDYFWLTASASARSLRVVLTNECGLQTVREIPVMVLSASTDCVYPSFSRTDEIETGKPVSVIATNDFNGDSRSDIVLWDGAAQQLKTYAGQANGKLILVNARLLSQIVGKGVSADFNRDGKADLALQLVSPRAVQLYFGQGDGSFSLNRTFEGGDNVVMGDLNRDGVPDLVIADIVKRTITILLNQGRGEFNVNTLQEGLIANNPSLALAHINGDDLLDLAVGGSHSGKTSYVFFGDGQGGLRLSAEQIQHYNHYVRTVAAADVDLDGKLDVIANYLNEAGGPDLYSSSTLLGKWQLANRPTGGQPVTDVNLDGKPDAAFGTDILLSGKSTAFCALPTLAELLGAPTVAAGDFNGDGKADLLGAPSAGGLTLLLNRTNSLATVSAATFSVGELALGQLAAAFGTGLATVTQQATTIPLPTALAGISVRLRDGAGVEMLAPLFFVSPGQINFQIPPPLASGTAQVQISDGSGIAFATAIQLAQLSPGIFTAQANGRGVAAGQALYLAANGAQRFEPLAIFDAATSILRAVPVDLSNPGEQVFLVLYGTGIRGRSALNQVTATIGGTPVEVLYAGAQGALVGVDQVNLRLPRTLVGSGDVEVVLTVEGKAANAVRVALR